MDLANTPQLSILFTVLISALVTSVPVFFLRWKLRAEVETVRLNAELAEARRLEAVRLEMERLKAETTAAAVAAQKIAAEALEKKAQEDREAMAAQNKVLADIHGLTNSAKMALEKVEQDLRNELKATETAATVAATIAANALQAAKDLSARDLVAKDLQIAALMQELKGVVREPAPVAAAKVHDAEQAAKMDPNGDMVVVIPEAIVSVEAAKPLIVTP